MQHHFQQFSLLVEFTILVTLRIILFIQWTKFITRGFAQGDFIQSEKGSEKVQLKENYIKWN